MYWLSDGEIYHIITGYETIEEFNPKRAEEFKKVFGFKYYDTINDFVLNRYVSFKIDLPTGELIYVGEGLPIQPPTL